MSIPEREGVYLLCSSDSFGSRIYKVGRSDNLRQRLSSYSPNWCLLDCFPCEHSPEMERILIKGFKTNYKTYDRNEYLEIEADFYEIKHFFNNLMYETRVAEKKKPTKKERTVEEKPVVEREKKKKAEAGPAEKGLAKPGWHWFRDPFSKTDHSSSSSSPFTTVFVHQEARMTWVSLSGKTTCNCSSSPGGWGNNNSPINHPF
jgi:hypothetical protein